jgi:hypothetical protein
MDLTDEDVLDAMRSMQGYVDITDRKSVGRERVCQYV